MNPDCTVVIITHERPRYLERCVRWFVEADFPVVVADSSRQEWQSALRANPAVHYMNRAGGLEVFIAKLKAALAEVRTPYVALCDDDDFLMPEGIGESIAFLKTHPDYSFCAGYTYMFQPFRRRLVVRPLPYNLDVSSDSWIDRVEAVGHAYYGVTPVGVTRAAFDFLARQDFSENIPAGIGFIEFCLAAYVARRGKLKQLPVLYHMREYGAAAVTEGSRPATIASHMVPDFFRNLLEFLAGDDKSEDARTRLLRYFSRYYAGILAYDLSRRASKRQDLSFLPKGLTWRLEYWFRIGQAVRSFAAPRHLRFLRIYSMPAYRRVRPYALLPGDRPRP